MVVLLVEDNPGDAVLVREYAREITAYPVRVEHANRLSTALDRVANGFDAVLLDLSLPDATGLDGLHRVLAAGPDVPVLVLTGRSEESTAVAAVHAGAQDYLLKHELSAALLSRALRYAVERQDHARRKRAAALELEATRGAARRAAQLAAVFGAIADPVLVYDADARVVQANPAATGVLGFDPVGLTYARLAERLDLDPEAGQTVLPNAVTSTQTRDHGRVVATVVSGETGARKLVFQVSASPLVFEDGRVGAVAVWRDVTERESLVRELARKNAELADLDRRKDEFLAMLGHELRNPLAPIANSIHILGRATPASEQSKRALAVIERQVGHMTRLVGDLLDVTRITQGRIRLQCERVELTNVVRRIGEDLRSVFVQKGIQFDISTGAAPIHAYGDFTRLYQVVGNILQNAAKFTPAGGRVTLSLDAEMSNEATIRVRDTGRGMSANTLAHLFEPFVQGESTLDRSTGGLGLGLALAKALTELHGGTVKAHSNGMGKGSEFIVRLPLTDPPDGSSSVSTHNGLLPRRVLIIEDNTDAADTLKESLEFENHVVAIAHSGPEGIERARTFHPDVVLCDIGLPAMDGYQVAQAMRADPELRTARLIALSGYAAPEDVERAQEAGFDRHVAKPPTLTTLQQAMAGGSGSAAKEQAKSRGARP